MVEFRLGLIEGAKRLVVAPCAFFDLVVNLE